MRCERGADAITATIHGRLANNDSMKEELVEFKGMNRGALGGGRDVGRETLRGEG